MQRYLMNIAYMGTKYNGVTKNVNIKDHYSVEDALRAALAKINAIDKADIYISSRTDAGVHATNTTIHIDLNKRLPHFVLTKRLNSIFTQWHESIRILRTTPVRPDFDSRREALSRTYLYRFAVCKEKVPQGVSPKIYYGSMFIPIEESYRCHFVLNEGFDVELMKAAAKQMEGIHDFRSFMKVSKEQRTFAARFCYRNMQSITVKPGNTLATSFNYDKTMEHFDFYNIEFKSRAYFYRQIRNMVGTLIAVGNRKLDQRMIYEMLTIPSKYSWNYRIVPAPSHGLYLTQVEYPPDAIQYHVPEDDQLKDSDEHSDSSDSDDDESNRSL